jgi:hypothetical protein
MRQLIRQLVNKGINAGLDAASSSKQGRNGTPQDKATAKRVQQSARMMRRLTRF